MVACITISMILAYTHNIIIFKANFKNHIAEEFSIKFLC